MQIKILIMWADNNHILTLFTGFPLLTCSILGELNFKWIYQ